MPKRRLFNRVSLHHSSRRPAACLNLEALEDRNLLTGLVVTKVSPIDGGFGVGVSASVRAWFNKPVDQFSLNANFTVVRVGATDPEPGRISAIGAYSPSPDPEPSCGHPDFPYECTATFDRVSPGATPDPLDYETTYRATLKGGPNGVRSQYGQQYLPADVTWTFTTARDPALGTEDYATADVPILVVTSEANPFSSYYAEILRAEGLNALTTCSIDVDALVPCNLNTLSDFDVVLLGEVPIAENDPVADAIIAYVQAGGNLIAMRPDNQRLRNFLELGQPVAVVAVEYLEVQQVGPGLGIEDAIMKFHGDADVYPNATATVIARLCDNGTDCGALNRPAVSLIELEGGGKAAAFTYDLAKSVAQTRQGKPRLLS